MEGLKDISFGSDIIRINKYQTHLQAERFRAAKLDRTVDLGATFQGTDYMPYRLILDAHRQDLYVESAGHMSLNETVHIGETRH